MTHVIDKKQVWQDVLELFDESPAGGAMFHLLYNESYLDSVEDGVATVCFKSSVHIPPFRRKAEYYIKQAFEEVLGYPVKVKAAVSSAKLDINRQALPDIPEEVIGRDAEQDELAILHQKYGDIMGIVDHHPVFKKASMPIEHGGYGIWPQKLTNYCKDYGVLAVLRCLRFISNRPAIRRPRGFFFEVMDKGQFGHKLVITPSLTGPQLEAV